jgi:hypothetical protein
VIVAVFGAGGQIGRAFGIEPAAWRPALARVVAELPDRPQ